MSDAEIRHDAERRRFETTADGHVGHVEYERDGDRLVLTHTIVPSEIGGRGIAGALVRATLDHARAEGLKVVPACSYADVWMRRHPEYEDIRG